MIKMVSDRQCEDKKRKTEKTENGNSGFPFFYIVFSVWQMEKTEKKTETKRKTEIRISVFSVFLFPFLFPFFVRRNKEV